MRKTIQISKNYQDNIDSVESEQSKTDGAVRNIYTRFSSEKNVNNMEYALKSLEGYRYVPHGYCIPQGHYVRYIDTSESNNMPLKVGGFLLSDNGYSMTIKSSANSMFVKINKRHCVVFVMITQAEYLRAATNSFL